MKILYHAVELYDNLNTISEIIIIIIIIIL